MRSKNEIKYNSMICVILNSLKINKKYEFIINKYNIKNAVHLRLESDWIKYTNNKDKCAYIDINNIIKFYIESEIFYNKIFFTSGENQIEISENFKNNNIESSYFFDINYEYELNAAINFEILVNSENFIGITRSTYSNLITIKRSLNNNNNNYIYNLNKKVIKRIDKGLHSDENNSILSNVVYIMEKFIALIVRCKDEPFITEFVNYYINQGVDKIYIIDDNSNKEIYNDIISNQKINIIFDSDIIKKKSINILYKNIKDIYEWIIYVDVDEFITTKKNINKTIKEELQTTFKDVMCIKVPWVMMSCNGIEKNPESLLEKNVYRWNHDNMHINKYTDNKKFRCRYNEIEVKCIFKPKYFDNIFDHHPINNKSHVKIVESVYKKDSLLSPYYLNLREKDIKNGYLLCYHYRIISIENCLNKIKNNIWYQNYKLDDIISSDYPELIDETLKNKYKNIKYNN